MPRSPHPPPGRFLRRTTVPKPGGGARRLTVLGPDDAATYAGLVRRLTPSVERRLGPEVFANRASGDGSLEPWRVARARWRRATARLLDTGFVSAMDVTRCYDSIRLEVLGSMLDELDRSNAAVPEVIRLLGRFRDAGVPGIPVGPPPSAILANAVLAPVDEAVRGSGARFVRWVDDFVIVAPDAKTLGEGERAVEAALAELGLVSNPSKHRPFNDLEEARAYILRRGPEGGSGVEILAAP